MYGMAGGGANQGKPALYGGSGGAINLTATNAVPLNTWTHIAVVKNGTTFTHYLNGVANGSATTASTFGTVSDPLTIGNYYNTAYTEMFKGYMSNVRIVKGTALYTAAFTPPTQLFAITNTSLLTCNSPAIVDQSSNAFAITANGNAAVSTFTPFQGYVAYNPALGAATPGIWTVSDAIQAAQTRRWNMYDPYFNLTTLLLHGNGTNGAQNNTFLDSSSNNFTITRNGNTTQGTFTPFSQTGWSNFFSSSYLTIANSANLNLGSSNFTIELWVYAPSSTAPNGIVGKGNTSSIGSEVWSIEWTNSSGGLSFGTGAFNGVATPIVSGTVTLNAWNHVAVVRSGNTHMLYINGISVSTATASYTVTSAGSLYIGTGWYAPTTRYYAGYISNFRIVIGSAVYTSNFTPSTTPLTAITNTQLLTCQDNRFIDNSSNAFAITVNGTPSVQAFSPFYPVVAYTPQAQGGSGYFDGSGDYLTTGTASALNFGTGNFTVEAWYYLTSTTNLDATLIADGGASYTSTSKIFKLYWSGQNFPALDFGSGNGSVTANNTAARLNQWNHVALVRSGNTFTMYLNGVAGTPVTFTGSVNFNGNNNTFIGFSNYNTPTNGYFTGYISGLRATNTVVYSANFTPPIAPPTSVSGTSLLLNYTNAGIIDSTGDNVLETVGNAQISTTQSKFGGSSILFNASANTYLTQNPATTDLYAFGSGDFTIECWLYLSNTTGIQVVLDGRPNGTSNAATPTIYINAGSIRYLVNASDRITGSTLSSGQWYHIAIARSGTSTKLFIDGTQSGSTYTDSTVYVNSANRPFIGGDSNTPNANLLNGYIDDFRITKGYARYTGNFTPQTSQWQDQ